MTTLSLTAKDPVTLRTDALVVGVVRGPRDRPVPGEGSASLDAALGGRLAASLAALGATGAEGEVTRMPTLGALPATTVVAVGLGSAPVRPDGLRRAAGAAARSLAGVGAAATTLAADGDPGRVRAVAEGLLLGGYAFTRYRSEGKAPLGSVSIVVPDQRDRAVRAAVARAQVVARAVGLCRDLVNTAPGDLRPRDLAAAAAAAAEPLGLSVEVLDDKALRKGGYGGLVGVGAGSSSPPRLVRLGYRHPKATRTVALVGKGITFDSGGLSLKPAQAMTWMKSDMGGAAAVLATLCAVAELKPAVDVVGWMACAENMPGGTAIRPSDVLTTYAGTTVEVDNTDAEGRLVLADAIGRAGEEHPDVIVDVATLTGAQLIALGSRTFAVMGNDDALRAEVLAAAEGCGEQAWPMPLPPELRKSLDSDVADIKNTGDRNGGMLVAGLFLQEFVPKGTRWVHLDVAGPAYNQGEAWGFTPKGGTGVPVRTLVDFLTSG